MLGCLNYKKLKQNIKYIKDMEQNKSLKMQRQNLKDLT